MTQATALAAGPILTATPATLAELLQSAGYRATEVEQNGLVQLLSASQGIGFSVRFGNRAEGEGAGFLDFTFSAVLQVQGEVPAQLVPSWNQSRRFARMWLQGNFLVLEMDVTVAGGVTADHLRAQIGLWDRLLQELLLHLRQSAEPPAVASPAAAAA
jgi:hypothetical protein